MKIFVTFLCFYVCDVLVGCAHIDSQQGAAFNQAVTTTATTLQSVLTNGQALNAQNMVAQAASDPSINTLKYLNSEFQVVSKAIPAVPPLALAPNALTDEIKNAITGQFNVLVAYSNSLQAVTADQTSFATSAQSLSTNTTQALDEINTLQNNKLLPLGANVTASNTTIASDAKTIAGGIGAVGEFILNLYAESEAYKTAVEVDPAVQDYCKQLQYLLYYDPSASAVAPATLTCTSVVKTMNSASTGKQPTGLLVLIYNQDEAKILLLLSLSNPLKNLPLDPANPNQSDTTDPNYATIYAKRVASLQGLQSAYQSEMMDVSAVLALRKAVGDIAQAHGALSTGNKASFLSLLAGVQADLAKFQEYYQIGAGTGTGSAPSSSSMPATSMPAKTSTRS